ncbi:hypothetical protein QC823_01295 [Halomonas vilamensis]|uniref:Uncharacterized protein n=1 Tax=Vreelandella vilamensis TaxID=531309 RepID=A0ABU1H002_9GAMM|nr:hypothetical protein [Halomonas vilamensis]MDR5897631.1 hypothetical protein [Halomonas vilamensis]
MRYTEAKEHTPGRLHELFADPYHAFDNDSHERQLHIRVMLYLLAIRPIHRELFTLRVIHGWENGGCEPADLKFAEYPLSDINDLRQAADEFSAAMKNNTAFPETAGSLLAKPLNDAMADAKADGQPLDDETKARPARWPSFEGGLALYTQFKMYHRLVYGEDDAYRSSQCRTSQGTREIHEFHLEEGEFAFLTPPGRHFATEKTLLILHESQLEPLKRLLIESAPLFELA